MTESEKWEPTNKEEWERFIRQVFEAPPTIGHRAWVEGRCYIWDGQRWNRQPDQDWEDWACGITTAEAASNGVEVGGSPKTPKS